MKETENIFNLEPMFLLTRTANKKVQHLLIVEFNSSSCSNPTPYDEDNSKCKIAGLMTARRK